jgi:hypothetical protein
MTAALIYTGHTRTWERCKNNHEQNIICDNKEVFFNVCEKIIPYEFYTLNGHAYDQNRRGETTVASTLNQWHNNFIGFCLVPRGFDVYVRIRPDITLREPIDLRNYDYSGRTVYIPHGHNYHAGVNDQVAWGNHDVMKVYYSVYLTHSDLFRDGVIFHTETYLTEHLKRSGIDIVRVPVDNDIIR